MGRDAVVIRVLWKCLWLCALSALITQGAMAKTLQLKKARVMPANDKTRVVFELTDQFHYHNFTLHQPERLVIDITNAKSSMNTKKVFQHIDFVKGFRSSDQHQSYLRLVFDLTRPVKSHVFSLRKSQKKPHRLVVDFPASKASLSKITHQKTVATIKKKPHRTHKHTVVKTLPKVTQKREIIVVIDPGHGGKDPGAAGVHGAREKTVVLQIAKRLQQLINKEPGFKAILTRQGDYYIGLRRRLALAHKYKADMFVAIHADAYRFHLAHGASVFALSERGATSEAARWLAQRENESEFVGGLDLADKDHLLRSVLIDLSQTHTISVSLQMGTEILRQLSTFAHLHHDGVEQAAFVVLKSPDIPSLLVETGFLSNPKEEKNLTNPQYQQHIATSIMKGIKGYFIAHPPMGTSLAYNAKRHSRSHKV